MKSKVIIIGSGPSGYTAAIYAARAGLKPLILTGLKVGGQLMDTGDVENFPGYKNGITGPVMMEDLKEQALRFGTEIKYTLATNVDISNKPFKITDDRGEVYLTDSIIISTGAEAKWLGLDSEKKYSGYGVSACATCDGFFYKDRDVVVVGGGDTACEESIYLSNICSSVTLLVRGDKMRSSLIMQERVKSNPKINILYNTQVVEVLGDDNGVNSVQTNNGLIKCHGLFIAIGHNPNTDLFKGKLELDSEGYIITKPDSTKTNVDGVFACGDVQDKIYRQAITAAGTGCMAALDAERYLSELENKF
jgi:thioredoxin reductase (NADPH)